ncbi:MAG: recombinase family protein [Hyphomonadaceae bacterium]|nr:recombinase family protein [Hyphomonadaceae bacterium]
MSSARACDHPSATDADTPVVLRRAVQYLRMSTDHQRYSLENQAAAIARFAAAQGFSIVGVYEDAGRSGLTFSSRPGLRRLIGDISAGSLDAEALLVFDVSRWGRFQDIDESAHYEFLCRRAGVRVIYCEERFPDDGTPYAAILKSLKRVMAAEYSRELSEKVWRGQRRLFESGFSCGSTAPFGHRRVLVGADGARKQELRAGERKALQSDRVILEPGPAAEQELVRQIFAAFVDEGLSDAQIANRLNSDGVPGPSRGRWTRQTVGLLLRNPKSCGVHVWNRTSARLRSPSVAVAPDKWVVRRDEATAIIDAARFEAAQAERAARRQRYDDAALTKLVRAIFDRDGHVSWRAIAEAGGPSVNTIMRRIGASDNYFGLESLVCSHSEPPLPPPIAPAARAARWRASIVLWLRAKGVRARLKRAHITVGAHFVLALSIAEVSRARDGSPVWRYAHPKVAAADFLLVARPRTEDGTLLDYFFMPCAGDLEDRVLHTRNPEVDAFRCDDLGPLFAAAAEARFWPSSATGRETAAQSPALRRDAPLPEMAARACAVAGTSDNGRGCAQGHREGRESGPERLHRWIVTHRRRCDAALERARWTREAVRAATDLYFERVAFELVARRGEAATPGAREVVLCPAMLAVRGRTDDAQERRGVSDASGAPAPTRLPDTRDHRKRSGKQSELAAQPGPVEPVDADLGSVGGDAPGWVRAQVHLERMRAERRGQCEALMIALGRSPESVARVYASALPDGALVRRRRARQPPSPWLAAIDAAAAQMLEVDGVLRAQAQSIAEDATVLALACAALRGMFAARDASHAPSEGHEPLYEAYERLRARLAAGAANAGRARSGGGGRPKVRRAGATPSREDQ